MFTSLFFILDIDIWVHLNHIFVVFTVGGTKGMFQLWCQWWPHLIISINYTLCWEKCGFCATLWTWCMLGKFYHWITSLMVLDFHFCRCVHKFLPIFLIDLYFMIYKNVLCTMTNLFFPNIYSKVFYTFFSVTL